AAGEDVADPIDRDRATRLLAPADEEAPPLAVKIAGGEPADAAFRRRANPRQLHQARPQPLAVDRQIAHRRSSIPYDGLSVAQPIAMSKRGRVSLRSTHPTTS